MSVEHLQTCLNIVTRYDATAAGDDYLIT